MNLIKLLVWMMVGILLILLSLTQAYLKIIIGLGILLLILFSDSSEAKPKKSAVEKASHETLYDAMKWIIFGIFVIIYPPLLGNTIAFLIVIVIFVAILFLINWIKEKNNPY